MKVLVLSRNYPNNEFPYLGLWVKGLVHYLANSCEPMVVAPTPYSPPVAGYFGYSRFRNVAKRENINGVQVLHPRFLTGPGYLLHNIEASTYYWSIRNYVDRLRRTFQFDIIHAHFTYPDGVVAVRLGQRYRVPVIITEHALWSNWMNCYPRVRRQAVWASRECALHIAVSCYVKDTIEEFTGGSDKFRVLPVGVDRSLFKPSSNERVFKPNQILFVGYINFTKGVDILLKAFHRLLDRRSDLRLILVGGGFYRDKHLKEKELRHLSKDLGLCQNVEFVGLLPQHEVAELMRISTLLVLPSRRESFGAVLVEALACGTPVVATRCGGPEEIVNEHVGCLVPKDNVDALVAGIEYVLNNRNNYEPEKLSSYSLENFSWERIAEQTVCIYREAYEGFHAKRHKR